jgi:HSP20 family protein
MKIMQLASHRGPSKPAGRAAEESQGGYHEYCPGETWTPAVNLYEDESNYYVVADLAGSGNEAIELDYHEGQLTISGHRTMPVPPEATGRLKVHHMEIDYGRFCRKLGIPADVDVDRIEAVYRAGQLYITLPKC